MNAAVYARVSTSEQKDRGYSLGSQVKECRAYAERKGFNIIAEFQDDISGATRLDEREGGKELIRLIEARQVQAVIVYRIDRLSRPPEDEASRLLTTIEHFARHGVTLHDCESGPIRNDMASIFITFFKGLAASQERAAIKERSMRGKREKARAGKWVGAWAPFGYRKVGKSREAHLVIDEAEAATVRRIFNLYTGRYGGKPLTLNAIARILSDEGIPTPGRAMGAGKVWLASTITESIIDRRAYIGEFSFDGIKAHFPELAIIDSETWQAAQVQRLHNKARARRHRPGECYLMSARMLCTCGGAINGSSVKGWKGRIYRYYRCSRARHDGAKAGCTLGRLNADEIDARAWAWLVGIIENDARLDEVIEDMAAQAQRDIGPFQLELGDVAKMLDKAEGKIARLIKGFGDADDDVIASAIKREINDTRKLQGALERRRDELEALIVNTDISPMMKDEIKAIARQARSRIREGGTAENKRELFEALDCRGQLIRDDSGSLKVRISCGLGTASDLISIDSASC